MKFNRTTNITRSVIYLNFTYCVRILIFVQTSRIERSLVDTYFHYLFAYFCAKLWMLE